jgi:hypothetical protein
MYYAGGSYNYAHETMELLHNIIHDWPKPTAEILEASMIFNTKGGPDDFLEGDMGVEHFNDVIKEQVHSSNATPALLEKIVPALGHIQHLRGGIDSHGPDVQGSRCRSPESTPC